MMANVKIYRIYMNIRRDVFLKFGTQVCEVVLILHKKCWTASLWTRPRGAKPDHEELNHGMHHQISTWDHCSSEILHSVEC